MNRKGLEARTGFFLFFLIILFLAAHLPALAAPGGNIVERFNIGSKGVAITSANKDVTLVVTKGIVSPSSGTKASTSGAKKFDPNAVLTKAEIRKYAELYGLTDANQFNWKMALQEGDFAYFEGQRWPAWRVVVEFAAKKMVLDAANEARATIPTKGDWAAYAERFMDKLPVDQIRQGKLD
ncbi:MAG: hypothetical protein HY910_04500 [Desulfarculus sp.]|nr:hypothetical protein [Desulfarculus sp.]